MLPRPKMTTSKYHGVTPTDDGQWIAAIFKDGRFRHLGLFDTEESAAKVWDLSALAAYGSFAVLNFPDLLVTDREYAGAAL